MTEPTQDPEPFVHPQKRRTGWSRLWHALGYSMAGLRAAWTESAFRQECWLALVLLPLGGWLGQTWVERSVLWASVCAVLVVELLNTALETAVDRISPQWHALSKKAKDVGSAAVLLTLLWCAATWVGALVHRFA